MDAPKVVANVTFFQKMLAFDILVISPPAVTRELSIRSNKIRLTYSFKKTPPNHPVIVLILAVVFPVHNSHIHKVFCPFYGTLLIIYHIV